MRSVLPALVLGVMVIAPGCTEKSSGVGPDPAACTTNVAPRAQSIGVLEGSGTITVAAAAGCTWTATTDVGWITLTPPTSGSGNGSVAFAVAPNTPIDPRERTGSVVIAGQRSSITQTSGRGCSSSIDPDRQVVGATGGGGAPIGVSTNCQWTAFSDAPWIVVTSAASGFGNAVVAFSAAANNTGATRTGTLTIAVRLGNLPSDVVVERTATIIQPAGAVAVPRPPSTAAPCPYTISPTISRLTWSGGGGHSVEVTTLSTCPWTATSNDQWITIVNGANGRGNGVVTFSIRDNTTGASRVGTLTIAGLTVTVTQTPFRILQ